MTSIGETLRRERLQQGLELQQLSQTTKIGTRMLQAMEQNDFAKLPGGVFTRSFVKQYAAALGLNPALLDEQLQAIPTGTDEPAKDDPRKGVIQADKHYSFSEYSSSTNSGSMLMSIFWIVAAMAVTGIVYYYMNRPQSAPVAQQAAKHEEPKEEVKQETKPVDTAPEQPSVSPQTSPIHLEVSTTEEVWLSITADGKSQFVGVMKPDEKKTIDASERIKVVAGNAGAVQLTWNGKPIEEIGPKGQVRVVEVTPAGAHVVPRTPKPALEP